METVPFHDPIRHPLEEARKISKGDIAGTITGRKTNILESYQSLEKFDSITKCLINSLLVPGRCLDSRARTAFNDLKDGYQGVSHVACGLDKALMHRRGFLCVQIPQDVSVQSQLPTPVLGAGDGMSTRPAQPRRVTQPECGT